MPFCRRDCDDAQALLPPPEREPEPVWREPPGMLGEYVRRVKRMAQARPETVARS